MKRLKEVTRHIRSKNAGPFWVTIDIFFDGQEQFDRYANCRALSANSLAELFKVDVQQVKHIPVADLHVLKVSYPRSSPQGGIVERDLHSGQQYVLLLDLPVSERTS